MRTTFLLGALFGMGCTGQLQTEEIPLSTHDGGSEGGGSAAPDIHFTPSSIDFGAPAAGSDVVRQITISNVGQGVLVIGRATASDSDSDSTTEFHTVAAPASGWLIGPGEAQTVEVVLRRCDCLTDSGQICFESNDPDEDQVCATLTALAAAPDPEAVELCNGADDDCDELLDEGCDDDGDAACDRAMDPSCGDCHDADASVGPTAIETCNGADEDCDGMIDEGSNGCGGVCRLDATLGAPCDGPDGDVFTDDTVVCNGLNATTCSTDGTVTDDGASDGSGGHEDTTDTTGTNDDGTTGTEGTEGGTDDGTGSGDDGSGGDSGGGDSGGGDGE